MNYELSNGDIEDMVDDELRWEQEQQRDQEAMQHAAVEALKKAYGLGLTESECMAIAHSAGLANDFYKEIRK